jgi:hypothetical protein
MADVPTTLALVTLAQSFRGDVVRQINRKVQALKMVRIVAGEGKNVAWVAESSGAIAENYTDGLDASNYGGDAQASALLTWSLYRSAFHVTQLAMDGAASSSTPLGNHALWMRQVINGAAMLAQKLNQEFYAGAGTGTTMAGLGVAIGDDANTYATIDRGAQSYWRPTVVDPGALTAPTFALLRDDVRKVYEACGENPDVALCSPSVFNVIGNLFDATRRQVSPTVNVARGSIALDFGYHALELDGLMFVKDKDCTANTIYYLNSNLIELQYLPSASQDRMIDALDMPVQADDGFGRVPLGFKYEMLAKTGPSEKAEILATTQLVVTKPSAFGTRKNVAT